MINNTLYSCNKSIFFPLGKICIHYTTYDNLIIIRTFVCIFLKKYSIKYLKTQILNTVLYICLRNFERRCFHDLKIRVTIIAMPLFMPFSSKNTKNCCVHNFGCSCDFASIFTMAIRTLYTLLFRISI